MSPDALERLASRVSADNDASRAAAEAEFLGRHHARRVEPEPAFWVNLPEPSRRRCELLTQGSPSYLLVAEEPGFVELHEPGQAPREVSAPLGELCHFFAVPRAVLSVQGGEGARRLEAWHATLARDDAGTPLLYELTPRVTTVHRPLVRQTCDHLPQATPNFFAAHGSHVLAWWALREPVASFEVPYDVREVEPTCTENTY